MVGRHSIATSSTRPIRFGFDVNDSIRVEYRLDAFFAVPEPGETPWAVLAIVLMALRKKRRAFGFTKVESD